MPPDYYRILELERTATQEEIKKAYKRLALKYHPDRNQDDTSAEQRFKQVSEAFRVLGDPDRRLRYDRYGETGEEVSSLQEVDIATVAEFFESIFGDFIGLRRRPKQDITRDLEISFEEAAFGVTKEITVTRAVACEDCDGRGAAPDSAPETCGACRGRGEVRYQQGLFVLNRSCRSCDGRGVIITDPCESCGGSGKTSHEDLLSVKIPAGTESGSRRVIRGYGEPGLNGAGDLVVRVKVRDHELFARRGHNIHCSIAVTYPQAVLGDEIAVPTIEGDVSMKIRPGTQPGQRYKLRGRGVPKLGGSRGDQIVNIELDVPKTVTLRQEELILELARELGVAIQPQKRGLLGRLREFIGS